MLANRDHLDILIVERSDIVRNRLNEMLRGIHGVAVVGQTGDPDMGNALAAQLKPDVIILDARAPEGKGMNLLQSVKHNDPAPCVVVLTDDAYPENRQNCMDHGADYFFDKSTEFQSAVSLVMGMAHRLSAL